VKRTDEEIKKNIVDQLYWDNRIDASKITVEVDQGVVMLSGTVPTYSARKRVHADAMTVPGVLSITDNTAVEYGSTALADEIIRSNIKKIIDWNPDVNAADMTVTVEKGWVVLEGAVETLWMKNQAEDVISNIGGVTGITNKLSVVPGKGILDEVIAKDIIEAMDRNVQVDVNSLNVKVDNGTVTLVGTVSTWSAYQAAYESALYTNGVTEIRNHLVLGASA